MSTTEARKDRNAIKRLREFDALVVLRATRAVQNDPTAPLSGIPGHRAKLAVRRVVKRAL